MEGKMAKILSWYDNEWGYSCRVGDLAAAQRRRTVAAAILSDRLDLPVKDCLLLIGLGRRAGTIDGSSLDPGWLIF
jgi:hypothetical protein